MPTRIARFADFWPVYLRAHAHPTCRALHYAASTCGIAGAMLTIGTGNAWWLLLSFVGAYGFAWAGHFFVERNVPLTFRYPLWSFAADYRMFGRWLSGRLRADLAAAGA